MSSTSRAAIPGLLLLVAGCDSAYPEVVVVNETADEVEIRRLSFSGCAWNVVLAYGEATAPGRCLPGEDRIHFEKFDAAAYCQEQAADGTLPDVCSCDAGDGRTQGAGSGVDPGLVNTVPTWFAYQTATARRVQYGEFHRFEIRLDDLEQDFSVPGPYGH